MCALSNWLARQTVTLFPYGLVGSNPTVHTMSYEDLNKEQQIAVDEIRKLITSDWEKTNYNICNMFLFVEGYLKGLKKFSTGEQCDIETVCCSFNYWRK